MYAGILAATTVTAAAVPALANNYGDTYFNFSIGSGGGAQFTESRAKEDKTSSYVNVGNIYGGLSSINLSIFGENYEAVGSPTYNVSYSQTGRGIYMANYVKEKGLNSARLKGWSGRNLEGGGASGKWSPDSI